ncbi:hypothetical protein [Halomonas sp. 3D7M]|uniref:hypothetical protein n=1 Tax=Halomonas sp. 3D7M TaxID=2742617 RepID=UPI001865D46D|nr:hypothetical protein [Halomonas sp. 3D7M]
MTTLEKTLIQSAALELKMLLSLSHDSDVNEKVACYNRVSALVMIAYLKNNGMTEQGVKELEEIEKKANLLMQKKPA